MHIYTHTLLVFQNWQSRIYWERNTHQVLSIWRYGHAQDVGCVSNVPILCAFPSTRYCVQFLSTLNIPWRCKQSTKLTLTIFTFIHISFFMHASVEYQNRIFQDFNAYWHLMMEQSLAAEKMYLSSEEMTRQVTGSLCPLKTLISEASGGMS